MWALCGVQGGVRGVVQEEKRPFRFTLPERLICPSAVSHPGSGQESQMPPQDEVPNSLLIN